MSHPGNGEVVAAFDGEMVAAFDDPMAAAVGACGVSGNRMRMRCLVVSLSTAVS